MSNKMDSYYEGNFLMLVRILPQVRIARTGDDWTTWFGVGIFDECLLFDDCPLTKT